MVNCNPNIKKVFNISYLKEDDIGIDNHKLSYSTSCNNDYLSLNKNLEEENRHLVTTQKAILNYDIGFMMTKQTCVSLLNELGDISQIRYVVLTNKIEITHYNNILTNYSYVFNNYMTYQNIGMKSLLVTPACSTELILHGRTILRSLIMNPPDSYLGISIVVDNPECNKAMLNVKRPGVLRQYFGRDLGKIDGTIVKRVAYRSQLSFKSEGSDPKKLIIKPFSDDMGIMADFFHNFLMVNKQEFGLNSVDLNNKFNSCSVLIYHELPHYKKQSSMGWHCDSKYSTAGKFSDKMNGQVYNTPVVIFSIGRKRLLKWRKRFTKKKDNGYKSFEIQAGSEEEMLINEGNICIINPKDEVPHIEVETQRMVHFQHGNTKVTKNDISVAFVFRVSPHECVCSYHDNKVILPVEVLSSITEKEVNGIVNEDKRTVKYNEFDVKKYHRILKSHFELHYKF